MINERCYDVGAAPSAIRGLFMWGLERKKVVGEKGVYDFSIGNPTQAAPIEVRESIFKHLSENNSSTHAYSPAAGIQSVRDTVAQHIKRAYSFDASAKNVFITQGATGALFISFSAICNTGEEVIVPSPHYPDYAIGIERAGAKIVRVSTLPDTYQLDLRAIEHAINAKTCAIVLNSPNNPTGAIYPRQDLEALAEILSRKEKEFDSDIYIISDEPYRKITYGSEVSWIPEIYPKTIVCYSLSKTLSLPGERIGYAYVSDTMPECDRVFAALTGAARFLGYVCAPVLFQRVMQDCIDLTCDISTYAQNRDLLCKMLDELGYEYVQPEGAFYLLVKSLEPNSQQFSDKAKQFDLLVVPGDSFGAAAWVRLSYCVSAQTILNSRHAFEKLKKVYEN